MAVSKTIFGEIDSKPVYLYTITNKNQTSISVMSYAATWQNFEVVEDGQIHSLIEHFDYLDDYIKTPYQVGKTVGRVAGRIKDAKFQIGGVDYQLKPNEGNNLLHGGDEGLQYQNFDSRKVSDNAVLFSHVVKGEDGFEGNLKIDILYRLKDNDEVVINYIGESDCPTLFNPTCHVYFNLNDGNLRQEQLQINAKHFLDVDAEKIPTGKLLATTNAYDFKSFKKLGQGLKQLKQQGKSEYDDVFNVDEAAATIKSDKYAVDLSTDRNGLVIYTANPQDSEADYDCLAMELQTLPDAINHEGFGDTILSPDQKVSYTNKYKYRKLD